MSNGSHKTIRAAAITALLAASSSAVQAGGLLDTSEEAFDQATFTDSEHIDNPWWSLAPDDGQPNYLYYAEGKDECEWNLMEVMGSYTHDFDWPYEEVEARIILDRSWVDEDCESERTVAGFDDFMEEADEPDESTYDWYAQDEEENIWYMGEDTYDGDDNSGSFVAGCLGAEAGIVVPGAPEHGMFYQQEFYEDEAEDWGKVLTFKLADDGVCMKTKEWTPLEPGHVENKFYCSDGETGQLTLIHELKGPTVVVELIATNIDPLDPEEYPVTGEINPTPDCDD